MYLSTDQENNNLLVEREKIDIYWGKKNRIKWVIKTIDLKNSNINNFNFNDISEDARDFFLWRFRHLQCKEKYKENKCLELQILKLDNWERIYLFRVLKYFWEWELDDTFYIYEEWKDWQKIWHSNLIKVISWNGEWKIRISMYKTEESEQRKWYWERKLLLMNYLSNKYFNENIKNISPIWWTEWVFDSLAEQWYARKIEDKCYDLLNPIYDDEPDFWKRKLIVDDWKTSEIVSDILKDT